MNKHGNHNNFDNTFKVVVIGDMGVGKSSILRVLASDEFPSKHISTICVEFITKTIDISGKKIRLQNFDTASQARFASVMQSYFRGAHAILIVLDATNPSTLDTLKKHIERAQALAPDAAIVIAINKYEPGLGNELFNIHSVESKLRENFPGKNPSDIVSSIQEVSAKICAGKETDSGYNLTSVVQLFSQIASICCSKVEKTNSERDVVAGRILEVDDPEVSSSWFSSFSLSRGSKSKENPYLKIIDGYKSKEMEDFGIVVKLLESYNSGYGLGIGWKHFKSEVNAILTLASSGYFEGDTDNLVARLKQLKNHPSYKEEGDLGQILKAIKAEELNSSKEIEEKDTSRWSIGGLWSSAKCTVKASVASSQEKLDAKYEKAYTDFEGTAFEKLRHLLQTYIGSRVSVNARTHAGVVNALLTLYQVDPNNKEQGSLKQTASDLYFAVIQLGNVEGYNSEQDDLLAMIGVIRKHKNELETVASKSFERFDI